MLSVLLVTYQSEEVVEQALEHIARQTEGVDCEIIVVDNASTDNTVIFLKKMQQAIKRLKIIENADNRGFGAAMNQAASQAAGECLLIANLDITMDAGVVSACHEYLNSHADVSGVSVRVEDTADYQGVSVQPSRPGFWSMTVPDSLVSRLLPGLAHRLMADRVVEEGPPQEVSVLPGCFMMLRRSVFEKIGGFDENLFMYFEDVDLGMRLSAAGERLVCLPAHRVCHRAETGSRVPHLRRRVVWSESLVRVAHKHLGSSRAIMIVLVRLLDQLLRYAICRARSAAFGGSRDVVSSHREVLLVLCRLFRKLVCGAPLT